MKTRLNEDQIVFFEAVYKIDNSAKGVVGYDVIKAIKWVAESESKSRKVIVLTENGCDFNSVLCTDIICISPTDFLYKIKKAQSLYASKAFSTLEDAMVAVFFI